MTALLIFISLAISLIISILIGRSWIKSTRNNKTIELNTESFRNPINTGITVSGFLLPMIVGIMTFSFSNNSNPIEKDFYVFSSIVLIIISIFFGLWNTYSLATLTDSDGKFKITSSENTTFPAIFVFQLSILLFAIIYFGLFGYNNISKPKVKEEIPQSKALNLGDILINKTFIPVQNHKDLVLESWGIPNEIKNSDSIEYYLYSSTQYDFTFEIKNDTIININQKLKK